MATFLHGMTAQEFLDSFYNELNLLSPSSYYYDAEFGVRTLALALKRAFGILNRHLRPEDTSMWQAEATLTVLDTTPPSVALPTGYVAPIQGYFGLYPLEFRTPDNETVRYRRDGIDPTYRGILVTRFRDALHLHSSLVVAGDTIKLLYYRELPVFVAAENYAVTAGATDITAIPSVTHDIAYANDEWNGGIFFDLTGSIYTTISDSTTTGITAPKAGTGGTITTGTKSAVLLKCPDIRPEALDALISQACLIIRGEDLNGWAGRVQMINKGQVRMPKVSLPKRGDQFRARW